MTHIPKSELIAMLNLLPHPKEGGYFRRTYESNKSVNTSGGQRMLLTSIYYMLTDDSPIGYLHRNQSDIIHYYHLGSPCRYWLVSPDGELEEYVLGPNLDQGEQLQLVVKGGYWKGSALVKGEYSLLSEAVAPGFDFADNELAKKHHINKLAGQYLHRLLPLLKETYE